MRDALEFLFKLATGDMTPEERRVGYKLLTTVGYRSVMIFLMAWAYGAFEVFGWSGGFARADSVEDKIQEAVRPIFDEQKQQGQALIELTKIMKSQLANSLATEIRLYTGRRCRETDPQERDRLQGEIDKKRDEYRLYRNADYNYGCGDV